MASDMRQRQLSSLILRERTRVFTTGSSLFCFCIIKGFIDVDLLLGHHGFSAIAIVPAGAHCQALSAGEPRLLGLCERQQGQGHMSDKGVKRYGEINKSFINLQFPEWVTFPPISNESAWILVFMKILTWHALCLA
jgi:hypothetical protein